MLIDVVLNAKQGDDFEITVADELKDESLALVTSIVCLISFRSEMIDAYSYQHWHGFFQKGTNEMDGVATVTQCPITPGMPTYFAFGSLISSSRFQATSSPTSSPPRTKPGLTGTTRKHNLFKYTSSLY